MNDRPNGSNAYFLNACNGLFVHAPGLEKLTEVYREFIGEPVEFEPMARALKLNVEREALGRLLALLSDTVCPGRRTTCVVAEAPPSEAVCVAAPAPRQ